MLALAPKASKKYKNIEISPFKLSIFGPRPYIQSNLPKIFMSITLSKIIEFG